MRSPRLLRAVLLLVCLDRGRLFLPPPSATVPDAVKAVQRKAAATAIQEGPPVLEKPIIEVPPPKEPPVPEEPPVLEVEELVQEEEDETEEQPAEEKENKPEAKKEEKPEAKKEKEPEAKKEKKLEAKKEKEPEAKKEKEPEAKKEKKPEAKKEKEPEAKKEKKPEAKKEKEPEAKKEKKPEAKKEKEPEAKKDVPKPKEKKVEAKQDVNKLKQEMTEALRDRDETGMVTMLNEFNPRSDDAAASSLMKALTALLPAMFGDELGFLVMTMAYSEIRAVSIWHELAEATAEAALVETHPRCITEMAFGFAWVNWQQPDLFALLQVAFSSCITSATEEQKRVFAWACARAEQPATDMLGKPSFKVEKRVAKQLWSRFRGLSKRRTAEVRTLKKDPIPLLLMPEAVPMMHCDALIKLANDQKLWVDSSELTSSELNGEMFVSSRSSSTAVLAWHDSNPSVKAVRAWAAHTLDVPENFLEPLQLVRYEEGQQIGSHMDWHDERDPGLWVFGQRMATVLVYLSNVPEGGETSFGSLGVSVQPQKGSALLWPNVNDIGAPEKRSIHSGRPLEGKQVKYALNIWVHGQKQPDKSWIKWYR